jgi:putative isomerase
MDPFSLDLIPFSTAGSFLTITARNPHNSARLLYRTASARLASGSAIPFDSSEFFEIALLQDGVEVPYTWTAMPVYLTLSTESGAGIRFTFSDLDTLLFHAQGVALRLMPCKVFPVEFSPNPQQITLMDWAARGFHYFRTDNTGQIRSSITPTVTGLENVYLEHPRTIDFSGPTGAIRFAEHEHLWNDPLPDFEIVLASNEKEYSHWLQRLPAVPETYQASAEQAWFILWNCLVPPGGALTRPAIYMSKAWMNAVWAWDNCFNALAVVKADPALAWDQLRLFFDHQEPLGMLPDAINDLEPVYGFNKPPVYGWAILKLIQAQGEKKALPYLNEIYKPLSSLTEWWYTYRDFDGDGIPQYHHGNDSGWDNATVFDQGCPTEGVDLAAFLVLQCEALSHIAALLDHRKAARRWYERAQTQLDCLLNLQVKKGHFFSPRDGASTAPGTHSLLNTIPILLGERLPVKVRSNLIKDLSPEGPFLTPYGLASEAPSSPLYIPDGYWRGPIWAPATYLIYDGLVSVGKTDLADTIAERFCNMCLRSPGFWENYDALTGQGLRCPGYSWTASVFLLLAHQLYQRHSKANR